MTQRGGKLLCDALDSHWRKYQKRLKTCRLDLSEDNVHELRISTRRLLALIELLRTLHPNSTLSKLRKTLKHQLDGFDELRDTQVMLIEITNTQADLPDLIPFTNYLQQCEQQLLQQIAPYIATPDRGEIHRKIQKIGRHIKTQTAKTNLKLSVLQAIDAVYASTLERYRAIDPAELTTIHHLRIPVKKLRYMLTAVQSLIPDLPENHLNSLQTYLTRMGDIQNSAVLSLAMATFFVDGVPEEIAQYYRKQQRELVDQFFEHRGEIFSFWRSTPDQDQPWESRELSSSNT